MMVSSVSHLHALIVPGTQMLADMLSFRSPHGLVCGMGRQQGSCLSAWTYGVVFLGCRRIGQGRAEEAS
jgi:hypothetical protein